MKITKDSVVSIHYTLTDSEGEVLDSSEGSEPLQFLSGHGNIIPGLENALQGKEAGSDFTSTIEPAEAYGEYDEKLVQSVPLEQVQADGEVELGTQFQVDSEQGPMIYTVTHLDDSNVTLDGNHPLAGETLTFKIEVTEVRSGSSEEITAGHIQTELGEE